MRLYFLLSYLPANYPSVLLALSPVDASSFSHLLVGALYTFTELAPSVPWIAKCLFPVSQPPSLPFPQISRMRSGINSQVLQVPRKAAGHEGQAT